MTIGTPAQLREAARGNMPQRGTPPPAPVTPINPAYEQALARRSILVESPSQRLERAAVPAAIGRYTGGVSGDPEAMRSAAIPLTSPTPTYGNILRGLTASRGGLSPEGKYGGFYSAEDQRAAIRGAAIGARETYVPQLRQEAMKRYTEMEGMKSEASRGAQRAVLSNVTTPLPSVDPSKKTFTPGGYIEKYVNPLREYSGKLGEWYKEQARPAEEYLATAQQLEATPLSELAQRIAVSQYGMNPDLARAQFSGLDAEYWKSKRDQRYVDTYGVPYDEFQAIQEEQAQAYEEQQDRARTTLERTAIADVERLTGFKASSFGNLIGRTPAQVAQAAEEEAEFTDANGQTVVANGAWAIQRAKELIADDPTNGINQVNEMVRQAEASGKPDIAALLVALMSMSGYNIERLQNRIYLAGLTTEP